MQFRRNARPEFSPLDPPSVPLGLPWVPLGPPCFCRLYNTFDTFGFPGPFWIALHSFLVSSVFLWVPLGSPWVPPWVPLAIQMSLLLNDFDVFSETLHFTSINQGFGSHWFPLGPLGSPLAPLGSSWVSLGSPLFLVTVSHF